MIATCLTSTYNDIGQIEMTNIEIISKKCSNLKCIWTTRSEYVSTIALSNFQLDRNWFKLSRQRHQIYFFEMANIGIISKKCSNLKCIWTTRCEYVSSIALSNFQLDRNLFNFHLQWYWTDFFEMTNIEIISKKCSNLKCIWTTRSEYVSSIALSNFQLDRNWFKLSRQRHQIYFFEMTNIEIIWNVQIWNVFEQRGVNMCHLSHWVIFNLIATCLTSTCNDIR